LLASYAKTSAIPEAIWNSFTNAKYKNENLQKIYSGGFCICYLS